MARVQALFAVLAFSFLASACDSGVNDGASTMSGSEGVATSGSGTGSGAGEAGTEAGTETRTDSRPLGSEAQDSSGVPPSTSEYPTTSGSGSAGSGTSGTATGPAPGPTLGTGR